MDKNQGHTYKYGHSVPSILPPDPPQSGSFSSPRRVQSLHQFKVNVPIEVLGELSAAVPSS